LQQFNEKTVIVIDNVLVSDEIIEARFVCDLSRCKGGCCEEGDAGAPLDASELEMVTKHFETIKPYLPAAAVAEIEKKGFYQYDTEFGWVTPTLPSDNEICVYAYREPNGLIMPTANPTASLNVLLNRLITTVRSIGKNQ